MPDADKYKELVSSGLCTQCRESHNTGTTRCKTCREKHNEQTRIYRQQLKKEHRCFRCRQVIDDGIYCPECNDIRNKMRRVG